MLFFLIIYPVRANLVTEEDIAKMEEKLKEGQERGVQYCMLLICPILRHRMYFSHFQVYSIQN